MKKRFFIFLVFLLTFTIAKAAYFEMLPFTIKQPNGKTINCFVSGDEFFNWIHDKEGYTIIQAPNGYYYYAVIDGDSLKPSAFIVNTVIPSRYGLKKWAKISEKKYQNIRNSILSYETKTKSTSSKAPHSGYLNNLIVYIRFSDDTEFSTSRQLYDDKLNPTTGNTLKSYYQEVSYNNLTINSSHYPNCALNTNLSFQDIHPRGYYQPYNLTTNPIGYNGGGNGSERTSREHQLLIDAINWININSPISNSLNLDGDGDNKVDNLCFIIKGNNSGWNDLLWAHRWALFSQTIYINGKRVYDYTFQPENQVNVRTLCHEMFHALGAPDLYHYTNQTNISPVGAWDLMETGNGHMSAYMKWKYSNHTWINTIPEITTTGTYTLHPITSSSNNCYKIASPYSLNEYFVVEYRKKAGIFESNIPGSGLLVYRIDDFVNGNSNGPPDEVYIYRPDGTNTINGNINNAFFSSTVGRTAINDYSNPNSFLQNSSLGGLNISNVGIADSIISFNVTFPLPCSQPSIQASSFSSSFSTTNSFNIGWTRGSGNSVLVIAKAGSLINAMPVTGINYTANSVFGLGTQIGTGNYVVYNGTDTTVNITALNEGTTYYFDIYEYNSADFCYKSPALKGNACTSGYCAAGATSIQTIGEYISKVEIGSINQTSVRGIGGYQNFSNLNTTMQIGTNYSAIINCINSYSADQLLIWADWNHDGDFNDAGENVYSSNANFSSPDTSSFFSPPLGAYIGTTRLRIRLDDSDNGPNPYPCNNALWGEVEDYSINIIPKTSTFTAVVSNEWEINGNWNNGVPDSSTNAYIPANKLAIVNTNNNFCYNLTIEPLGKLTINATKDLKVKEKLSIEADSISSGSLIDNGTLTTTSNSISCYLSNPDEYHLLSAPVTGQSINPDFNQANGFYIWNEPTSNWIEFHDTSNFSLVNNGTNFIQGKAYAVVFPDIVTKIFKGILTTGNVNIPLSVSPVTYSGWNIVGNPYPSAINWNNASGFNRGMLEDAGSNNYAIWVWNPGIGNYGCYISGDLSGTNGASNYIASSQGFWIKAVSSGIFSIENSAREHSIQPFLKSKTSKNSLHLKITSKNDNFSDEIIINFGYANNLSGAEKIYSLNANAPSLYSYKNSKKWSINNLTSLLKETIVDIGFQAGINSNFKLTASNLNNFNTNTYVYLKDNFTNSICDLNKCPDYSFVATVNDNANRFQLLFSSSPIPSVLNSISEINIYTFNKTINIISKTSIENIFIYDIIGQLVKTIKGPDLHFSIDMRENRTGCYLIKIITAEKIYSEKVVLK
ncbi:MAG: M6 family metalloprotease domain-containing protein [Bacteroidales bacterium]